MVLKPSYTMHDGYRMPAGFPAENFSSALRYRARPGDVFIATYPKCGTTWVQYMTYLLLYDAVPLPSDQRLEWAIPHLEEVGCEAIELLAEPRAIKTHLPFSMTPMNAAARYVCVARNPFDCVVSFYHHTRGFEQHYDFAAGTFDEYFECFLAGEVDFGDYFDHLEPWYAHRNDKNVLFLTYEKMKRDVDDSVSELAQFIGCRHYDDSDLLAEVVTQSSFANMRENQGRWSSQRPSDMPAFVRKGVVGDWSNYLSRRQANRLAEKFMRRSESSGIVNLWPDIVAAARA